MSPKVSAIIPVYNGQSFIYECIQSVISQSYKDIEIIVIDDGSTDDTKKVIFENFPDVKYIYQSNKGAAAARNRGILQSSGDYIAFLDSDDLWMESKISRQMELLCSNPDSEIIHTAIILKINGQTSNISYPSSNFSKNMFKNLLLQKGSIVLSSLLIKKNCFEKVGLFDEELKTAEDVHLFLRLSLNYSFLYISEPYVIKRHHDGNLTSIHSPYYGQHSIMCLKKIEEDFPAFSRKHFRIMNKAFYLRYSRIAFNFKRRKDFKNALIFYSKALINSRNIYDIIKTVYKIFLSSLFLFIYRSINALTNDSHS